jgi:hypothetical protein
VLKRCTSILGFANGEVLAMSPQIEASALKLAERLGNQGKPFIPFH